MEGILIPNPYFLILVVLGYGGYLGYAGCIPVEYDPKRALMDLNRINFHDFRRRSCIS